MDAPQNDCLRGGAVDPEQLKLRFCQKGAHRALWLPLCAPAVTKDHLRPDGGVGASLQPKRTLLFGQEPRSSVQTACVVPLLWLNSGHCEGAGEGEQGGCGEGGRGGRGDYGCWGVSGRENESR